MIYKYAEENNIDIVIVAEPNIHMAKGNRWLINKHNDAAFYIPSRRINIKSCETQKRGFVSIEIDECVIYSCYTSPNGSIEEFNDILTSLKADIIKQKSEKILVGSDFNAKSGVWGSRDTNARGENLLLWIAELNLVIHNKGKQSTFVSSQGVSHIDLLITTQKTARQISQ